MADILTSEVKLPYSRRLAYGISAAGLCLLMACCGGKDDGPNPPPANKAPVVSAVFNPVSIAEDFKDYIVSVLGHFSDPDKDDTLTYSVSGCSLAALNGSQIDITPAPDYNGSQTCTVKACDPHNACVTTTLGVIVTPVNDGPGINSISIFSALEGAVLDGQINAADPDIATNGDFLTYFIDNNVELPVLKVNSTTGHLYSDAPLGYDIAGDKNILIRVNDSLGLLDTNWYVITIANTNRAPTITDVIIQQAEEGKVLNGSVIGSDPDNDPVSCYRVSSTLPEAKVSPLCTIYSDAPLPPAAPVDYNVVVGMTDEVMDDTASLDFEVQRPPFAPGLNPSDNYYERSEGQLLQFTVINNGDPNPSDTITLDSPNRPANATLDPNTGQFSWPISYTDGGSGGPGTFVIYDIYFQEVDNHGARGPPITVGVKVYDSTPPP